MIRPCCHSGQCRVCLALKTQGGVNFFEELRPERPKAHSPGQGEQREPTPWVCSIPTTWRPERAKALNHKTVCWIITYFCRAFALSGRNLCVGHLSQGVAPCSRLPWAGRYCPFRARNDSALFYLLMGTLRNVANGSTSGASAFCEFCGFCVKILFRVRQNHQRDKIHKIPREQTKTPPPEWGRGVV